MLLIEYGRSIRISRVNQYQRLLYAADLLIAAHDPWFIQLLRIYSEESGFRVVQAFEGQDVLPSIHKEHPQVILMQVDLPGQLQAQDVFKSIQTDYEASSIPILVFSWEGHQAEQDMFHFSCMQLTEPVTYDNFTEALKKSGISLATSDGDHGKPKQRNSRRAGSRR